MPQTKVDLSARSRDVLYEKRIKCQCPCGYSFEAFCSENDAVALVKLHVERFHSDVLPFGITHAEALTLLKIEDDNKPKDLKKGLFITLPQSF